MKLPALLLCGLLFSAMAGAARAESPSESAVVEQMRTLVGAYVGNHQGRLPTSWAELAPAKELQALNDRLPDAASYPLEERYTFVNRQVIFDGQKPVDIVILRSSPIRSRWWASMPPRRYVIYREDGQVREESLMDYTVTKAFEKAGVPLVDDGRGDAPPGMPWGILVVAVAIGFGGIILFTVIGRASRRAVRRPEAGIVDDEAGNGGT